MTRSPLTLAGLGLRRPTPPGSCPPPGGSAVALPRPPLRARLGRLIRRLGVALALLALLAPLCPAAAWAAEDQRIVKMGSDVTIPAGQKVRCVLVIGGQATVEGAVEKSVIAIGGSVVLTKSAVAGGSVTALGGVIVVARDAEVGGDLTEINSSNLIHAVTAALSTEWEGWSWVFAVVSLAIFLVILVLALLIVALLPRPVGIVAEAITEHTFKVVLCGILGLVLIAPLALLLTVSVVGIVLIPLEIIVVVCLVLMGFIAVGQFVGQRVLRWLGRPDPAPVKAAFWGLILLWLVGWLPYIGWMVKVLALVVGLGATLVTRFGTYRGWACVPTPLTGPLGAPVPATAGSPSPSPAPAVAEATATAPSPAGTPAPLPEEPAPALPPVPPPFAPEPPAPSPDPEEKAG